MAIKKLTAAQVDARRSGSANEEYVEFLKKLKSGEGGETTIADEGVSRQTIKNRLNKAAAVADVKIKFIRSASDQVVFEVVKE